MNTEIEDFIDWDNESPNTFGEAVVKSTDLSNDKKEIVDLADEADDKSKGNEKEKNQEVGLDKGEINWDEEDGDEGNKKTVVKKDTDKNKSSKTNDVVINTDDSPINSTIEFLKSKGHLSFELEEGVTFEDLNDDEKQDLLEEGFESALDGKIEEITKSLSPVAKNILKIASKGESVEDYLMNYVNASQEEIEDDLDLEDEDNQVFIMSNKLKKEGYDDGEVDSFIDTFKKSNKLKSMSEKEYAKQLELKKENQKAEQLRIDNILKEKRAKETEHKNKIVNYLKDKNEILGIKFSKKEISELPDYIAKSNVDLGDGRRISSFYQAFFTMMQDTDKALLLAKFVKSDLDFSTIQNSVEDNVTKKFRTELQRKNNNGTPAKFITKGKSLAELL